MRARRRAESAAPPSPLTLYTLNRWQLLHSYTPGSLVQRRGDRGRTGPVTAKADESKTLPTAPGHLPGPRSHLPHGLSEFLSVGDANSFGFQKPLPPSSGFRTAQHPEAGLAGKRQLLRRCSSQKHQRGRSPALPATE